MKQIALLLGIDAYPSNPLRNAVNDATALADKLRLLNFDCVCCTNCNSEEMDREIDNFKLRLETADVGLFFFAGHGVQCKGENFLTSTTTQFTDESSCKHSSISLNYIIDILEDSKVNTKIIILDACRDNPFTNSGRSVSVLGLAPVNAPKGTIIAYATSPGQKALDGPGNQGVYTRALLQHINAKHLPIEDMFKRVRHTVSSQTGNRQISWEHTSLMGNFIFNTGTCDGSFVPSYSNYALADANYYADESNDLKKIINSLKSHNWYTQNLAMIKLKSIDLLSPDIDDLFVLGRNIYQSACGNAKDAIAWIEDINKKLKTLNDEEVAFHILNGVLFEIYFDRNANPRQILKTEHYEPILLCLDGGYERSAQFINHYLGKFKNRRIYTPGTEETITMDIIISFDQEKSRHYLDQVCIDGLNCIDETQDFALKSDSLDQLKLALRSSIAAPPNKVEFVINLSVNIEEKIYFPYYIVLTKQQAKVPA